MNNNPSTTTENRTTHHHMNSLCDVSDFLKQGEICLVRERIPAAVELHSRAQDALKKVGVFLALQKELTAPVSLLRIFYDRLTLEVRHLENGITIAKKVSRPAVKQ